jgi:hypothetical protein
MALSLTLAGNARVRFATGSFLDAGELSDLSALR